MYDAAGDERLTPYGLLENTNETGICSITPKIEVDKVVVQRVIWSLIW
jgi:hypothetical protein